MRKATATKLCANWCGAHEWCGAFYLSLPFQDGGRCHLVDRRESQGEEHVATYGGVGGLPRSDISITESITPSIFKSLFTQERDTSST